jgi:hypothetical protein
MSDKLTPQQRAERALAGIKHDHPDVNKRDWCRSCVALDDVAREITEAVAEEPKRCAEIAWKMQMQSFGGGTAIGNAIQEEAAP